MQISNVHIKNFRGIKDLNIDLDDFVVIVGENNSGKSTILDAIQICLPKSYSSRYTFEEYDYHLGVNTNSPSEAEPIEIIITFSEKVEGEWPEEISQKLLMGIVQPDDTSKLCKIMLRVRSEYDAIDPNSKTEWEFLNVKEEDLRIGSAYPIISQLSKMVPIFYLPSIRDANREFRPRAQFWKDFIQPQEISEAERLQMEQKLRDINDEMLAMQADFSGVKERLKETAKIVDVPDEDEIVSIEAIPSKISDVLKNARVHMMSKTKAMIPLSMQGQGTQNVSILLLFKEFVEKKLNANNRNTVKPILVMEEPEAHLHPSACSSIAKMISDDLPGQRIITTHSGDFLAGTDIYSIRRISCKDGETKIHRIIPKSLDNDVMNKINIKIRYNRGNLLFARCWLLVEGETESILFPECARSIGKDLFANGVHCVEYSNIGIGISKLIEIANALGINWIVFADNDKAGKNNIEAASKFIYFGEFSDYIFHTDFQDIEELLQNSGFHEIYAQDPPMNLKPPQKIKKAIQVTEYIQEGKGNVPELLEKVINRACELGRNV